MIRRCVLLFTVLFVVVSFGCGRLPASEATRGASNGDQILARALEERARNLRVEGEGVVVKVLPDDQEGDRHQCFIVRLRSGQTLLIAHNIDQAPRIASLQEGDTVAFSGEYEWNSKGGVIHWTHQDRGGRHPGGWLKHNGHIYQ